MNALGKLFRTTAFKLSFAYLLVFTLFAFVTLGYVAWSAQRLLTDQFVSTIEAEIAGLSEQYRNGGLRRSSTSSSAVPARRALALSRHHHQRRAGRRQYRSIAPRRHRPRRTNSDPL